MEDSLVPSQSEVNIGLVGHVDHGKTSITKMLTGKWTDTHSEEIKRGISIRLGYADTTIRTCDDCEDYSCYTIDKKCPDGTESKVLKRVSFVDAPGHETLMATMLSGAALMHGAMLVIAANENCPQPRTIEHLTALKLGGINQIVVVQNKIDLVTKEKAIENYNDIKKFLAEYGYNDVPIIPVSANLGINKDALIYALSQIMPDKDRSKEDLKMYVVRSFDVNSPGTKIDDLKGGILGGSVISGTVNVGDEIEINPGINGAPIKTKVVSLNTEFGPIDSAHPGGLIAIGTTLDPSITQNDKMVGQVCAKVGILGLPKMKLRVKYESIDRLLVDDLRKPLVVNEPLIVTIGTATNVGKIRSIKDKNIEFDLSLPSVIEKGQRIALSRKSSSGWRLYGYGICE